MPLYANLHMKLLTHMLGQQASGTVCRTGSAPCRSSRSDVLPDLVFPGIYHASSVNDLCTYAQIMQSTMSIWLIPDGRCYLQVWQGLAGKEADAEVAAGSHLHTVICAHEGAVPQVSSALECS